MTHIFESREIKKKHLIFHFKFDQKPHYMGKNADHPCTMDKYMSLEDWISVFRKLDRSIERYMKSTNVPLPSERLLIRRVQLELNVEWVPCDPGYRLIPDLDLDEEVIYPYVLKVSLKNVSRINEFQPEQQPTVKVPIPTPACQKAIAQEQVTPPAKNDGNPKYDIDHEEYIPMSSNSDSTTLVYTPTPVLKSASTFSPIEKDGEYLPKIRRLNAEDEDEYRPAFVGRSSQNDKLMYNPSPTPQVTPPPAKPSPAKSSPTIDEKSSRNPIGKFSKRTHDSDRDNASDGCGTKVKRSKIVKITSPKANVSQDLFGDSDQELRQASEPEGKKTEDCAMAGRREKLQRKAKETVVAMESSDEKSSSRMTRKTPKAPKNTVSSSSRAETSLVQWLKTDDTTRNDRSKKSRKRIESDFPHISSQEMAEHQLRHEQKMSALDSLQKRLDEINKPVEIERIIDIKDMPLEDFEASFETHDVFIKKMFDDYLKQDTHRAQRASDYDHIMVVDMLVTPEQQRRMLNILYSKFVDTEKHGATAFSDLFFDLMVPEWALIIFIKRYKMTRAEAVDQLRKQEQKLNEEYSSSFELENF